MEGRSRHLSRHCSLRILLPPQGCARTEACANAARPGVFLAVVFLAVVAIRRACRE